MKKPIIAFLMAISLMVLFSVSVFAEGPYFLGEIDVPAISPQYQTVDGNFYLSSSEDVWVEVEYDASEIGGTSIVSSTFHLLPALRSVSSFILFPEQSGYFTITVKIKGEEEISATFSKWIMVDPDPQTVVEVSAIHVGARPAILVVSRVETTEGIWTVLRRVDIPSGPVVANYVGPSAFYSPVLMMGEIRSIRGTNSLKVVPGGTYIINLLREGYSMAPPHMENSVFEREIKIPSQKMVFLPLFLGKGAVEPK